MSNTTNTNEKHEAIRRVLDHGLKLINTVDVRGGRFVTGDAAAISLAQYMAVTDILDTITGEEAAAIAERFERADLTMMSDPTRERDDEVLTRYYEEVLNNAKKRGIESTLVDHLETGIAIYRANKF